MLVVIGVLPLGDWLISPLESRFPPVRGLPQSIDGIVVLGGAERIGLSAARQQVVVGAAAERLVTFVMLGRRYPRARLVYTGGSGSLFPGAFTQADIAERMFAGLGVDMTRVAFDREARNTHENAVNAFKLASPIDGETWLIITSAWHMPRAIGAFRAVGWDIVPYPVDYETSGEYNFRPTFDLTGNLAAVSLALREWIGLAAYRLLGWTDSLLPGAIRTY